MEIFLSIASSCAADKIISKLIDHIPNRETHEKLFYNTIIIYSEVIGQNKVIGCDYMSATSSPSDYYLLFEIISQIERLLQSILDLFG